MKEFLKDTSNSLQTKIQIFDVYVIVTVYYCHVHFTSVRPDSALIYLYIHEGHILQPEDRSG